MHQYRTNRFNELIANLEFVLVLVEPILYILSSKSYIFI